tara:strand:+ start:31677 stop:32132 length:456 start_codon:yes stop_codon:yes gene_type:complete
MSSIPELLKMGFDNDDWSYVSEAYHMLMGEYLLVKKPTIMASGTLEPEQQGFAKEVRETVESSYISRAFEGERPAFKNDEDGQQARKEPIPLSKDRKKWVDDGTIASNEKVSENPSLGVAHPVERKRTSKGTQTKKDVRLDKSEKLKDINE